MSLLEDAGKDTVVYFYLVVIAIALTIQALVYESRIKNIKEENKDKIECIVDIEKE